MDKFTSLCETLDINNLRFGKNAVDFKSYKSFVGSIEEKFGEKGSNIFLASSLIQYFISEYEKHKFQKGDGQMLESRNHLLCYLDKLSIPDEVKKYFGSGFDWFSDEKNAIFIGSLKASEESIRNIAL